MRRRLLWIAPLALLGMVAFVTIGGLIVKHLWNWLLPSLFGWREITFWQGLGLLALCRILFGGVGLQGAGRSSMRRHMDQYRQNMTPEEREQFRLRLRARWGFGPSPDESQGPPSGTMTS